LGNCSVPEGAVALQLPPPQTAKLVGHGVFRGGGRVLCACRGLSPGQHPAVVKNNWLASVYKCTYTAAHPSHSNNIPHA
jgi:hypothetical protein